MRLKNTTNILYHFYATQTFWAKTSDKFFFWATNLDTSLSWDWGHGSGLWKICKSNWRNAWFGLTPTLTLPGKIKFLRIESFKMFFSWCFSSQARFKSGGEKYELGTKMKEGLSNIDSRWNAAKIFECMKKCIFHPLLLIINLIRPENNLERNWRIWNFIVTICCYSKCHPDLS